MIIRKAVPADAPVLTALMHASTAYGGDYARILDGYEISVAQVRRDPMFVADDAGRVLGFYSLTNLETPPELDLMFVADAAQGAGVGSQLFEHLRNTARELGISAVRIVSHPPAEHFYLRQGAQRIGVKGPSGRVSWARPILMLHIGAVSAEPPSPS